MKDYLSNDVRNVVLLGHSQSGKTSIVDASLYFNKQTERLGSSFNGTSFSDFDLDEIRKKQSCYLTINPIEWKDKKINFIDTPGYLDYQGEMQAGIKVSDNALIVIDAKEKVQSGTIKAYNLTSKLKLPTIFFINKIDEENTSFHDSYNDLREKFGKTVIAFEIPIVESNKVVGSVNILRKKAWYIDDKKNAKEVPDSLKEIVDEYYNQILESIAMLDDDLMEKYFSGENFSDIEIVRGLRIGIRNGEIKPVYCGSCTKLIGIERLLDLISEYFPCYMEKGKEIFFDKNNELIELETNEKESLSAFVFKTVIDPFVGKISYLKVLSGVLNSDSVVYNSNKDVEEKISNVFVINGKYQIGVGKLFTGDIGAVVKLQETSTNDTLCFKDKQVKYETIDFAKPMLGYALFPKTKNDEDKMSFSIAKMCEEDLSINFVKNKETNEQLLYVLGDQHMDLVLSKLKSKYKIELDTKLPTIQYRETITAVSSAQGKHKKQTGGAGQYGDVWVRFEPCDCQEMIFDEEIFGGAVPRQYFSAVEQGLRESMNKGVLAGYKVVGVKAVLYDGSYHDVDSKEIAFVAAAKLAYKAAMPKAKPILLEPIGKVKVIVPEEYTGTIIGDLNKKRGLILLMDSTDDGLSKIEADVPMSEMQTYATEIRSMAQGRGEFVFDFDRYEPAPNNIQEKVIKQSQSRLSEE